MFAVLIGGCTTISSSPATTILLQLDDISTGASEKRPSIAQVSGVPVLLYSTKDDRLAFNKGEQRQLIDETARVKGGNFTQLRVHDQRIYATWWSHQDGKNIYFTTSNDKGQSFAQVSAVNDDHGVLPPFSFVEAANGIVGMIYHDERLPNFQAYFNRSNDYGRTWEHPDQRLDIPPTERRSTAVHEPQLVNTSTAWVSVWTDLVQLSGQATFRIVSRRSENLGKSWAQPEVLYTSDHQISSLIARAQGENIVVAADDLARGVFAVTSTDSGGSWNNIGTLSGTQGASNSGIDLTIAGGRSHLVWMQDRKDEKTRIIRGSLDVREHRWLGVAQRHNTKPYENTRAVSPVILATTQGLLLSAWVDYRDIRTNIYLATSSDNGESWSEPQPLLKQGEIAAGWPQLVEWGDQAAIGYEIYPSDTLANGKFVLRQLTNGAGMASGLVGLSNPTKVNDAERQKRLNLRIKTLWEARLKGDYDTAYDIFDFAYKATQTKKSYVNNSGIITYRSYTLGEIAIAGTEASVPVKISYEVKPTVLEATGREITKPVTETDLATKWVWVDNDWFMVFSPAYDATVLKY